MYDCLNVVTEPAGAPAAVLDPRRRAARRASRRCALDRVARARRPARGATADRRPPTAARIARPAATSAWRAGRASWPPRSGSTPRWTGRRPVRPGVAAAARGARRRDEPAPDVARHAADRHRLRRRAVGRRARGGSSSAATRRCPARPRRAERGRRRWTSARSRSSSSRPSATGWPTPTSFPPSRRLAEALEPSSDPVIVARGLDETDQARALLEERPGVGIGAAHDIGPAIERAARGGRLDPAQFLEIADDARRDGAAGDVARRRATAAAARARPRAARAAGAALDAGPQLRPGRRAARHGVAAARRPARGGPRRLRPAAAAARRARRRGARQRRSRSRSSRFATGATSCRSRPRRGAGSRASSTTRRAAARRCSSSRSWRSSSGNAWREAQVAEAEEIARILDELSALVAANAAALRETLDALARFDLWAAKASLAADMDATRAETADRPEVVLLSARHPGLTGRVVPIDIRLGDGYTALVVTGPNTGGKTVTLRTLGLLSLMHQAGLHVPAAAGQPAAGLARRLRRHRRRAVDRPVAVDVLGPPALDHPDRRGGRAGHARPARRARRRHGPDRGLGAGPGAARPLHPGRRARRGDDPLRRAQGLRPHDARRRATPRSSSTSRRCRRPTA